MQKCEMQKCEMQKCEMQKFEMQKCENDCLLKIFTLYNLIAKMENGKW